MRVVVTFVFFCVTLFGNVCSVEPTWGNNRSLFGFGSWQRYNDPLSYPTLAVFDSSFTPLPLFTFPPTFGACVNYASAQDSTGALLAAVLDDCSVTEAPANLTYVWVDPQTNASSQYTLALPTKFGYNAVAILPSKNLLLCSAFAQSRYILAYEFPKGGGMLSLLWAQEVPLPIFGQSYQMLATQASGGSLVFLASTFGYPPFYLAIGEVTQDNITLQEVFSSQNYSDLWPSYSLRTNSIGSVLAQVTQGNTSLLLSLTNDQPTPVTSIISKRVFTSPIIGSFYSAALGEIATDTDDQVFLFDENYSLYGPSARPDQLFASDPSSGEIVWTQYLKGIEYNNDYLMWQLYSFSFNSSTPKPK